ncbi:Uncharacterized protein PBTT_00233 [Plasmodiophora brassicae]|nr:hypothetical protein PBRA_002526 [Plasmodiophora brassicae]
MSRLEFTDFNKLRAEAQAVAEAKVLADEEYNRALTAWAELQKKIESIPAGDGFAMNCPPKRYFHVQGIDEQTGSVFWLPRFLGELHPPAGLLSDEDLLHFVSSLEFQHRSCGKSSKKDNMKPPMLTWSDPFYFLDKRKGTVRDHAILLCNFLLARMHDAYVCIGSIRQPNHELTEHVWVMTRELEKSKIDESLPPKSTIKFWETTTGTVYTLDSGKVLRFNERKNDDGKWVLPVARPEIILDPKKAAQQIEGAGERSSDLPPGSPRRKSQRHVDLKKNEQGFGSDLLGIGIAEPSPTSSSVCAEAFSVLTELEEARKRFEVEKINEQTERLAPLRIPEFEGHPTLPYVCLDVVFNNVRLYANVQSANPQLITYNFNTEHDRWFEFPFHITTTKEAVVGPFYNKKPLRPKASSYEVKQATFDIARTVEVACSQFREFSGDPDAAETRFFTAGALPTLDYRMDIEEKYTYDRRASMRPISDEPPHTAQRTSKLSDWHDALQRQLPPGFRYTEKVLAFKHADGSRIADTVVRHCKEDILQIRDAKLPQFAIRVKIEEMPCSVCPVRVLLAAVYKAGPDDDPDWKLQANLRAKQ